MRCLVLVARRLDCCNCIALANTMAIQIFEQINYRLWNMCVCGK